MVGIYASEGTLSGGRGLNRFLRYVQRRAPNAMLLLAKAVLRNGSRYVQSLKAHADPLGVAPPTLRSLHCMGEKKSYNQNQTKTKTKTKTKTTRVKSTNAL